MANEIKVRGLNAVLLKKIDVLAKKSGLSRNRYIVNLLEQDANTNPLFVTEEQQAMDMILNRIADALDILVRQTVDAQDNYQKIFILVALLIDIEPKELNEIILLKQEKGDTNDS